MEYVKQCDIIKMQNMKQEHEYKKLLALKK